MNLEITSTAPALPEGIGDDSVCMVGRQAILNTQREVFGYELFDRSTASHTAASDAAMLFNALSYAGTEALVGSKMVFINCTHESLVSGHLELINPEKVVLEIPTLGDDATPELIASRLPIFEGLRQRGFRLAFDQYVLRRSYLSWLPTADFIKLNMFSFALEHASALVQFATKHTQAQIVAEKVETQQQFEHMRELGVSLFQGFWFAKPGLVQLKTVRPSHAAVLQLLNLVRKQSSAAEIEEVLKQDPVLSFNLLRIINSSGFGLSHEITSFKQAILVMGLKKLFRWAALLLTTSRDGDTAPAVAHTAVVRGRLMELLTTESKLSEETDNAFIVGVFSLLDAMLGLPLEKALASIALPQEVRDALLHRKGVYAPFLDLVLACETGDEVAFARNSQLLGLSNHQINWAHLQALAWADRLNDTAV